MFHDAALGYGSKYQLSPVSVDKIAKSLQHPELNVVLMVPHI